MNILITGGYGFLGSSIAERFFKEGHRIHILDNLTSGSKDTVDFKHRHLVADVADRKCETFFKTYAFDVVIHCANSATNDHPHLSTSGLFNLLSLSEKYGVKQFVFFSTRDGFAFEAETVIPETASPIPRSPSALNQRHSEEYALHWGNHSALSTLIFRLSSVYGPKQHISSESRWIHDLMSMTGTETLRLPSSHHADLIFIGDVVEAVYRGVISELSGLYHLSSGESTSIDTLCAHLGVEPPVANQHVPNQQGILDNRKLKTDLDWVPRYGLEEGLHVTKSYYAHQPASPSPQTIPKERRFKHALSHPVLRTLENLTLFLLFFIGSLLLTPIVDTPDYWFIYVLLAALLFGKSQALIASLLAVGVHLYESASIGRNILSLFVDNSILATFTMYLLIGLVVSYVMERRKIEIQFLKDELAATTERHTFLNDVYEETLTIKNQLQQQILHSEESIGSVYEATRALDSLEPEGLFVGSISVLEKTLKANQFAIYMINQSSFARLAAKSSDSTFTPRNSLQIEEQTVIHEVVASSEIVFNTSLTPGEPLFGAPLIRQGEVMAVILCYEVPFHNLTLSYRNLIDVMVRLINSSLDRSLGYINAIQFDRYVGNTNALKQEYFERILIQKEQAQQELNIPYSLVLIEEDHDDSIIQSTETTLRTTDYLGFRTDGRLYAILSNATKEESQIVIDRLARKAIRAEVVEDVTYVE
ncbi:MULTISPECIES: NAD-dependent epimerase/dehydratase family protein [unclassified Exiguobacterium]|uniref:NAD-dependent epimerase/dehydratase family protein n=1 Tax=unclassified Exiguobacterium TaxID=2644629 RepID=UPI001BE9A6E0|nr:MULTISPECIES: NAD-dependent epimerase/dehydratase family protein [unclassified Exiguobacterium]